MKSQILPWVLGIGASHNGSVCLLHGDEIVVAVQEERLTRTKRARIHGAVPSLALAYSFDYAGIQPSDLSIAVICTQRPKQSPLNDLALNPFLRLVHHGVPIRSIPHHLGHAVSALATSGFVDAAILVVDGMGSPLADLLPDERDCVRSAATDSWESVSLYDANGSAIKTIEKHMVPGGRWLYPSHRYAAGMPHFGTLGGMYAAVGRQIFAQALDGSGKVMGLAPYGTVTLPTSAFYRIESGELLFADTVPDLFPHDERWPARQVEYQNLAASVQGALEEAVLFFAHRLRQATHRKQLCYAGGVALNSVANERLIAEAGFEHVYIIPAAEDSGTAIGAAYYGLWELTHAQTHRKLRQDALGREYRVEEVNASIKRTPAVESRQSRQLAADVVGLLSQGRIVGWFDGRSELGPRALGHRSILCDPRQREKKDELNIKVKHREVFRPFAPVVLLDEAERWFETDAGSLRSPFMLRVCRVRPEKRGRIPAVVHVDGTARLQTLTMEDNPILYGIVKCFFELTGVPIVLNTSFNVAGEPIVESPDDALWCLLYTGLDACVIGDQIVSKKAGYSSILDLYAYISARDGCVQVINPKREFTLSADNRARLDQVRAYGVARDAEATLRASSRVPRGRVVRFLVDTPWGSAVQVLDAEVLRVLNWIDGQRSGWEILRLLQQSYEGTDDEPSLVHALGVLRRASVISFREASQAT